MADDRDRERRRSGDGDATVQIPAELLSILPPPDAPPAAPERTPTPPPPGPAATVPPPPPPPPVVDATPLTPGRTPVADDARRGGGAVWLIGALVVVVLFVALCYVVVAQAEDDRPRGSDVALAPDGTAPTTAPTTTAPTPTTQAPAEVAVVVLNGTPQVGWAGENVARLSEAGYEAEASDAAAETETTTVYIAEEGLQADGAAVATAVGLPDAPVTLRPAEPLGVTEAADSADVVVVLGADSLG